jgi:Zn-dependent protease with chaperone function
MSDLDAKRKAKREAEIDRIAAEFTYGDPHKAAQAFVQLLLDKPEGKKP